MKWEGFTSSSYHRAAGEGGAEQRLGYEAGEQLDLEPLMKPSVCSGQAVPRQELIPHALGAIV